MATLCYPDRNKDAQARKASKPNSVLKIIGSYDDLLNRVTPVTQDYSHVGDVRADWSICTQRFTSSMSAGNTTGARGPGYNIMYPTPLMSLIGHLSFH